MLESNGFSRKELDATEAPCATEVYELSPCSGQPRSARRPPTGKDVARNGKRKKRRRRKKGGWPERKTITRDQWREALNADRIARNTYGDTRRRIVISINPPAREGETVKQRKCRLNLIASSHIPQAFKRAKHPEWIAWTVWQHPIEGRLHCHVIAWIDPEYDNVLARVCDGADIHKRPWNNDVRYLLMQRQPGAPEWEARQQWRYVPGQPIKGSMLSISRALKDCITLWEADRAHKARPAPAPRKLRDSLFDDLPALPPPVFDLAAERRRRGLSQAALAELIGLKQPHIANVERGHDSLSPARLRAIRYVLDRLPVAA